MPKVRLSSIQLAGAWHELQYECGRDQRVRFGIKQ